MAQESDEHAVVFDDLGFTIRLAASAAVTDASSAADATLGWDPQIVLDGEALPFSRDSAQRLYQRLPAVLARVMKEGGMK